MKSSLAYCPSCGENVETFIVVEMGDEITKCTNCGLVLDDTKQQKNIMLSKVLVAEDSKLLREMTEEIFIKKGLTKDIVTFEDGNGLIEGYIKCITKMDDVSLIILDIKMPKVSGLEAAIAVRDIEKDFSHSPPTPILFFTALKVNEQTRNVLQKLSPAAYVNKGKDSSPDALANRLYNVILSLYRKKS